MLNKLLFVVALSLCIVTVNAQQRMADQFALNINGGVVPSNGWNGSIGIEKYIGSSSSSIKLDFYYMDQKLKSSFSEFKANSYLGNLSYVYSLETFIPSPFYVNLNGGVVFGQRNTSKHKDSAEILPESGFEWGVSGGVQLEIQLYKKLSLVLEPKIIYLINADFKDANFLLNGGLKLYL